MDKKGNADIEALLKKYRALLTENKRLREELKKLKPQIPSNESEITCNDVSIYSTKTEEIKLEVQNENISDPIYSINKLSDSKEKIRLFMSLFKGREDVYAKRWENNKKGTSGYSPGCANEWKAGLCQKPKMSCSECKNKDYLSLNEDVVEDHLRGRNNLVVGIYPMLMNETCHFLAIDFDDEGWRQDVSTLREVCYNFNVNCAVERSRSGHGAHLWFFFIHTISAVLARKFGSALLTYSMARKHDISFKSYDRFFPNQDTMPKGGFGNLIALPLQKAARADSNSVFLDDHFQPYEDQWGFLASIRKLSEENVEILTLKLCQGNELGLLKLDEETEQKPWETIKIELKKEDFPKRLEIVKANMLYIPKAGVSQRALNHLKRLAAFKNPEYYKAQAMRMLTFNKPRIISCADETNEYLCLPRGCEGDLNLLSEKLNLELHWVDNTYTGKAINVEFKGDLRDQQPLAVSKLLEYENGILCGTAAFGKTVAAIRLIAEKKTNTLILVNRISLLSQWKNKLTEFLEINEALPPEEISKGNKRKKTKSIIGMQGGGKHSLNGVVDIAVMQSLSREGDVNECVKNYGMVIVDECHHVSAFSFELILKSINAKYIYGLTATPSRKDGHQPIIFMQCGPIRFRDDEKKQAANRPFNHYVIPRITSFRMTTLSNEEEREISITELYARIILDEERNQMIIDDVINCHETGRNCIILTERTAHVELIAKKLSRQIPDVISVRGAMGAKETRERLARITNAPKEKSLTIVATGRYIGEGFDEPRLDTLFLAMPISWKGTLQQYAGRLHRLYERKKEVLIYDYSDIHVRMLEKMYSKRLSGYASIGYKIKEEKNSSNNLPLLF